MLPELKLALSSHGAAVLVAEPGAGKTTRTPLELLAEPWMVDQNIIMLEPRRLAARSAAMFMAKQLGEKVGETVGYIMRLDSVTSAKTRITVVTEGILTRMLQSDPALLGVGLIIFDEFHERSLHADLGLSLVLQSKQLLREDMRILIMSATLETERITMLLGEVPVIRSRGRMFPVDTYYVAKLKDETVEQHMERTIRSALRQHEGSILAFLPGVPEIRRVERLLAPALPADVNITPLYGNLTQEEQMKAIQPSPVGIRKVVLATSIAESSITVAGVTVVIDSGLRRTQIFSPRRGMSSLITVRAARDSAEQRKGRAGRVAPGSCYRLWSESEDHHLLNQTPPEMLEGDLTSLCLEIAAWGASSPDELAWLDHPPQGAYGQAVSLLEQLGALQIDEERCLERMNHQITQHGREMAQLGMHPRLAHMLLKSVELGCGKLGCYIAVLLEENDLFRGSVNPINVDLRSRIEMLLSAARGIQSEQTGFNMERARLTSVLTQMNKWQVQLHVQKEREPSTTDVQQWSGILLSYAYPDRIGKRRKDGRYLLTNGRGAIFSTKDGIGESPYIVACELEDQETESRIRAAIPLEENHLELYYRDQMKVVDEVVWDDQTESVRSRRIHSLGAIVFREQPNIQPTREGVEQVLLEMVQERGMGVLPWNDKSRQLQQRIIFLKSYDESLPDVSDEALLSSAAEWLIPSITGFRKLSDLKSLQMYPLLDNRLTWEQKRILNEQAPMHITVPSGSNIAIQYSEDQAPFVSVRLQEVFGWMDTPRIAFQSVPLILHLLSPAGRPVQVTSDLRSFWQHTYFEVKKDLKGRYPKHYWPDNPLEATATRKVRPNRDR